MARRDLRLLDPTLLRLAGLRLRQRTALAAGPTDGPGSAWWPEFLGLLVDLPYGEAILENIGVPAADVPALLAEIEHWLAQR